MIDQSSFTDSPLNLTTGSSIVLGITGQIAAGKSTLAGILCEFGGVNLEVDEVGHRMLANPEVIQKLTEAFGSDILDSSGSVSRKILGRRAFASPATNRQLNDIMHPPMILEVSRFVQVEAEKKTALIIVNAALLYTMGLDRLCDAIVYVRAPANQRLNRMITARGMPMEAAKARLFAQDPEPLQGPRVFFCDNQGPFLDLCQWVSEFFLPQLEGVFPCHLLHQPPRQP
ncbi:MAG TPA: dephospho-CoA kinase [Candidatus Ozemobacteraceae bacterium]|nr:dephospho-CoA kinase [Candidatus Ozemobacteraceae bacterium]